MAIMFIVLCGFSFYLGGIFYSEKDKYVATEITKAVETSTVKSTGPLQIKAVNFPECLADFQDYTPCTDPKGVEHYYRRAEIRLRKFARIANFNVFQIVQQ
ncbi:hypothetical protein ACS0TY_010819 [Phlomoides rotata]